MSTTVDFALPALEPVPGLVEPGPQGAAAAAAAASEALVAQARAEADAIREEARAAGHAEGLAASAGDVAAAVASLTAASGALGEIAAELPGLLEDHAVELALAIASQVLGGALEVRPELIVDVVRGALRRLVDRERVTLLVHPEDLDVVRAATGGLLTELGGIEHCEVQAERRVARGGAMVRTAEGEIDASLETKLVRVREVIAESLAQGARIPSGELAQGAPSPGADGLDGF